MEIEEAITHCEAKAKVDCSEYAEEHRQLAEWLQELQKYKDTGLTPEQIKAQAINIKIAYSIIDSFEKKLKI